MNSNIVVSKERDSNLELYRILVMLLIVAHHYIVNSGLMPLLEQSPFDGRTLSMYVAGMWGKTGINCFVLITGYYMCRSRITVHKFLKLLLEVMFYKIVIYLVFLLSGYEPFTLKGLLKSLTPISGINSNFTGCYLVFFLFIPFLNVLLNGLNRKGHLLLLGLSLGVYTILGSLPKFHISLNYVTWFSILYFIGAYLRTYDCFGIKPHWWKWIALASIVASVASVIGILWVDMRFRLSISPYGLVSDSNRIFAVTTGISLFMAFKHLKLRRIKIINLVARSAFGVLLIHANSDTMRRWLWVDICGNAENYMLNSTPPILHLLICVLIIYAVCTLIDYLRITLVEVPLFRWIDKIKLMKLNR